MTTVPEPVDPFDLPPWLGEADVVWSPEGAIGAAALVPGHLRGSSEVEVPCDLLAVDEAYPAPVADDALRSRAHQSWRHGQVHLVSYAGRLTLLVPGREFTADRVLDALGRLALALGGHPDKMSAVLNVGRDATRRAGSGR